MGFLRLKHTAVFTAVLFLLCFNACQAASKRDVAGEHHCGVCGKVLEGRYVLADGKKYHPACFKDNIELRCAVCGKPIHGVYARDNQGVYHETCFREFRLEKCIICRLPIEGEHVVDSWGQSAHPVHKDQKVMLCDSCGRIICFSSKGGFRYTDGRLTCGICKSTAVTDETNLSAITSELSKLLASVGIGPVSSRLPVKLVDRTTLIRESRGNDKENTRGFTKTVRRIVNGKTVSFSHKIYILYGLPLTEFKGVLAHEMIHVWLNEAEIKMSPRETEGFCNLGIWLVNTKERSDFSRVLQNQLEHDDDEIYGDGYRMIKSRLDQLGWPGLITWIRSRKDPG